MTTQSLQEYYTRQSRLPRTTIPADSPLLKLMDLQIDLITKYKRLSDKNKVLEVGCAEGFFLEQLLHKVAVGIQVHGIEPSRRYAETARERLPQATIHETFLEQTSLCPGDFDLIVVRHVLEHLYCPVNDLTILKRLLCPSGALYIEVPDADRIDPTVGHCFHHEHLTYFTQETIEACLARAGLRPLVIERFKKNPPGSGFSYPVLRVMAVPDATVTPRNFPGQPKSIWKAYVEGDFAFCRTHLDPIKARLDKLSANGRRLGLFGAGPHTVDLLGRLQPADYRWQVVFDNNPNKTGKTLRGIPIVCPNTDALLSVDSILVSSAEFEFEMVEQIRSLVGERVEIIPIYSRPV